MVARPAGLPESAVRIAIETPEASSAASGLSRVLHVGAELSKVGGSGEMPPVGVSGVRHAVEAGLYACAPAVFERLRKLCLHQDYFTIAEVMQVLATRRRLGGFPTAERQW